MENSTELESIRGVGHITADKLRQAGYDSFEKLAATSPEELKEKLGLNVTTAANIIGAAGETMEVVTPELPEEPEPLPVEVMLAEAAPAEIAQAEVAPDEEPANEEPAEASTEPSHMEGIISQVADGTADYALAELVERVAAAIGGMPDIGGKLLEEVMKNPASRIALVSKTAERLAALG